MDRVLGVIFVVFLGSTVLIDFIAKKLTVRKN